MKNLFTFLFLMTISVSSFAHPGHLPNSTGADHFFLGHGYGIFLGLLSLIGAVLLVFRSEKVKK